MMPERPILMAGEMVRATLDGRKTQTRRLVKLAGAECIEERDDGSMWPWSPQLDDWIAGPYETGMRLWVREAFIEALGKTWYRASPPKGREHEADWRVGAGRWTPSIHMPRKASRLTLEVTSVRVERLQAITTSDIWAEGVQIPIDAKTKKVWIRLGKGAPCDYLPMAKFGKGFV